MFRRHLITSLILTVVAAVGLGLIYPLAVFAVGKVAFPWRSDGSFVKQDGKVVGSSLIGQNFFDAKGNPDPRYFQSRPSAAGTGYDALSSAASNLGPSNPLLVGFVPGLNTVDLKGNPSKTNAFATKADPYCVPTDTDGNPVPSPEDGVKYAKDHGEYVCDTNTVPERVLAYRALNHLPASVKVPADAVTASASGLDPDISVANAELQVARVASARHLPQDKVLRLVHGHTNGRQWGFLGERTVNVLDLNLALDDMRA